MDYNVIKSESIYEETQKRSKFISYSFKVNSEAQIFEKLGKIKSLHHDAKHHVYGYALEGKEKCFDDGEPSGTAGMPILNAIKSLNLKNVMVVIVRYFGGVLLGTGGLRRMYSSGAMNVLKNSGMVKMTMCSDCVLKCEYNQIGQVSNAITSFGGKIFETSYLDEVKMKFYVKSDVFGSLKVKLENILKGKNKVDLICENHHEID